MKKSPCASPEIKALFAQALERLVALPATPKILFLWAIDLCLLMFSLWLAGALRHSQFWPDFWIAWSWLFLMVPLVFFPAFMAFGVYKVVLRYSRYEEISTLVPAIFLGSMSLAALSYFRMSLVPLSVVVMQGVLSVFLLFGVRSLFRRLYSRCHRSTCSCIKVVIYGAGAAGRKIVSAFEQGSEYLPVAFIDDNEKLRSRRIEGLKVYSPEGISRLIDRYVPDMCLLAIPSATPKKRQEILNSLIEFPFSVKSLPGVDELIKEQLGTEAIREIHVGDLLGREKVPPNVELIGSCVAGKSVLVTGSGGSIGSELCRQLISNGVQKLVLYDHSEFALYAIEKELLASSSADQVLLPVLGSVTDRERLTSIIETFKVDLMYHAAAYKHVPLVELNPFEGIKNNIIGTLNAALAARDGGVDTFLLISTDKAVRPTNVMGATKRMAELVLQSLMLSGVNGDTKFTMVRFGNVLGSSGSVVPLFKRQIEAGGPVTVTHPEITRFFMTISEAVELVLQAGAMADGGEVFVLDMGDPVKIRDLAFKMIRLAGRTPKDEVNPAGDIPIEYTGLRPGEKLFEELMIGDNVVGTTHPKIMRAQERCFPWDEMSMNIDELKRACRAKDTALVLNLFERLVEGYCAPVKASSVWKQA